MNNPFETIKYLLEKNQLTADEKRRMKTMLVSYMSTHPVKSGLLSPYMFRYATLALASLVLVLGGSIGLTSASYQALPTSKLYPVKLWIEEYQAKNQKTPEAVIAFETKRIETRFAEAAQLAVNQELDEVASASIQAGIEHSRESIKQIAERIQNDRPEIALAAANALETTFSSNGKILATIEQNTFQNVGPIVLAAQITTKTLATEKTKFEEIIALKSDDTTKTTAEKRLAEVTTLLATIPTLPTLPSEPVPTTISEPLVGSEIVLTAKLMTPEVPIAMTLQPLVDKTPREKAADFIADAQTKMTSGAYSEALVLIEKAGQLVNEIKLTNSLEKTYLVDTTKKPILE